MGCRRKGKQKSQTRLRSGSLSKGYEKDIFAVLTGGTKRPGPAKSRRRRQTFMRASMPNERRTTEQMGRARLLQRRNEGAGGRLIFAKNKPEQSALCSGIWWEMVDSNHRS
jgi:hypothetical protein